MSAAKIASGTVSHHEIPRAQYINTHKATYDPKVLIICHVARHTDAS